VGHPHEAETDNAYPNHFIYLLCQNSLIRRSARAAIEKFEVSEELEIGNRLPVANLMANYYSCAQISFRVRPSIVTVAIVVKSLDGLLARITVCERDSSHEPTVFPPIKCPQRQNSAYCTFFRQVNPARKLCTAEVSLGGFRQFLSACRVDWWKIL